MGDLKRNVKSIGLNNLFDATNCAFYVLAFFSLVIDYRQDVPFPLYILTFVLGPPMGLLCIGKDEFTTWRWNALYNRRYYWHALLNFVMLLAWCVEIQGHISIEERDEEIFPIGGVRNWIDHIEFAGSVLSLIHI